jgi:TonB family protein
MSQRNERTVPNSGKSSAGRPGGTDGVSRWLIRHAARRSPESLSQRLEEEWLADWTERPTAMSRLRFALGCCWATQIIALEFQPSRAAAASVAAAGGAVEAKLASSHAGHDLGYFSRRSSTLILVASLHAVLFYGLVTTLSHVNRGFVPPPLVNRLLDNTTPRELPPPIPRPQLNDPKIEAPMPEFNIPREPDTSGDVIADPVRESSPPQPPAPSHVVKQVRGGPGAGFPNSDQFYPDAARRLEEQGMVTVRVCVDAHGRLTADPTTLQGSGIARLDEGALKLAKTGSGHYRASTEDGQPVNSCYAFLVRFQLKN